MNYALAFLTSVGREDLAAETLRSFEKHVYPKPHEALCVYDGPGERLPPLLYDYMPWNLLAGGRQRGFCEATRELWKLSRYAHSAYVFWLEDDFLFERTVDLRDIVAVMQREPTLAQMALYRQPCNSDEERFGGYMAQNPDAYKQRGVASTVSWFEHRHHWTTNPSLIRRSVIVKQQWPDGPYCEGKFGIELREQFPDTTFGIWGAGDIWVRHVGVRIGTGY